MPLFGNNYDTSLKPQQAKLNLSVDPYISQQMPFEHGIEAMPASPYGGGPSEDAQTITTSRPIWILLIPAGNGERLAPADVLGFACHRIILYQRARRSV